MADYKYDNVLVTCPYDEAHRLKASRLQQHIAKCKLNHLDKPKEVCPFNATHLLDRSELNYHLMHCPDRGPLDRHMAQTLDKNNPYKGNTSVPAYSDPTIDTDENWDLEPAPAQPISSRTPPPGALIEPPAMSKPKERKDLYRNLHRMYNESESNVQASTIKPSVPAPVARKPNPIPAPIVKQTEQTDPKTIQNLGLGRGKNRIAANFNNSNNNINNNASNGMSEKSYSNVLKNMGHLGLGRGQPANPVPPLIYDDDDDEFPALGCGRGAFSAPKRNPRIPGVKSTN